MHGRFQLCVLHLGQDARKRRSGLVSHANQVVAREQPRWLQRFNRRFGQLVERELVVGQVPVAGQAVQAVQFQVLVEPVHAQEPLLLALAHKGKVLEAEVMRDQSQDLSGLVVGEAQARQDPPGHFHSGLDMTVEADALVDAKGRRLADVVKQHAPGQLRGRRAQTFEHQQGVDPDVAFRVELGWLRDSFQRCDLGQRLVQQAGLVE